MSLAKRIGRSSGLRQILSWLIASYIRLVWAANRWSTEGSAYGDPFHAAMRPYIAAFWHGRMLIMPCAWPRVMQLAMLQSPHPDGRVIADAIHRFGFKTIWGSSNRGASDALRRMIRALKEGDCVAITPDGDGPAMAVSAGIVQVARLSGAAIVPVTYATSGRIILSSWDRFHLPLPFGRGIVLIGEPIEVPSTADKQQAEALRALLEARLRALTAEADRRMGHRVLAPGTLSRAAIRARRRAAAGSG